MSVTTMKCSARRTALRRIQSLVNELININEQADRTRQQLIAAGITPSEVANSVDYILAAAGPSNVSTADTSDKLVGRLIDMLAASANTDGQVGWSYLAE